MRRQALILAALLSISFVSAGQAGWWHHHCCQSSAPAYYVVPVASAPADNSQSALWEGIVTKLIEKFVIPTPGGGGTPTPTPTVNVDLSKVESKLDTLAERVENINTTLRTHGETLVSISDRLDKLEKKSSGGDANATNKPMGN